MADGRCSISYAAGQMSVKCRCIFRDGIRFPDELKIWVTHVNSRGLVMPRLQRIVLKYKAFQKHVTKIPSKQFSNEKRLIRNIDFITELLALHGHKYTKFCNMFLERILVYRFFSNSWHFSVYVLHLLQCLLYCYSHNGRFKQQISILLQ
jgi:hypothetical protein